MPSQLPEEYLNTVPDDAPRLDLGIDVRSVLRQLPKTLQKLAYLLPHLPITEVCLTIGKSRSRVYQMIREIRVAFIDADLGPGSGGCG